VPLALTDKVYIRLYPAGGIRSFADIDPAHAASGCAGCHGGTSVVDAADDTSAYRMAHTGMMRDPSAIGEAGCSGGMCHGDIVRRNETSMHSNLWGEKAHVALRNNYETFEDCPVDIKDGYAKDCNSCHTTCGQCHISRPDAAGGGFLEQRAGYSHKFIRTPSEENVCTACHGSRVGDDWNANQERVPGNVPDLHNDFGYSCLDCHQEDLHGDGATDANYTSRYEVADMPKCIDCHQADRDDNAFHVQHWPNADDSDGADLSCQTCHSQQYNNCNTCHAGTWKEEYLADNTDQYRVYPQFKIGLNPYYGNESHPHSEAAWITVRHVPASPDAFENWGIATMSNYNAMETWKYTSPHNIQRWTERTLVDTSWRDNTSYTASTCNDNCHMHGDRVPPSTPNSDVFLTNYDLYRDKTRDDLSDEIEANVLTSLGEGSGMCAVCH